MGAFGGSPGLIKSLDSITDFGDLQRLRLERVVEIGGVVSDFVGGVDQLSLEGWLQVQLILGQLGMSSQGPACGNASRALRGPQR